jgi:hypothetical protein
MSGELAQLRIHDRHQLVERFLVSLAPLLEQNRDRCRRGHKVDSPSLLENGIVAAFRAQIVPQEGKSPDKNLQGGRKRLLAEMDFCHSEDARERKNGG